MGRLALCAVCSGLIAMTIGCGDDGSGGGGSGGSGGAGGSVEGIALLVTVTEAPSVENPFEGAPLEGVELCEADTANCDSTDADGKAHILLPADQEVTYTLSMEGYGPYVIGDESDLPVIETTWPMISNALLEADAERLMVPWPWDPDGIISLAAFHLSAGVTYELLDEEATPYYRTESGVTSQDLTETTSNGRGGFHEVSPGVHQIEFGGSAVDCVPDIGWPGDAPNRIRVPVRAGHISYGSMNCQF